MQETLALQPFLAEFPTQNNDRETIFANREFLSNDREKFARIGL
jgi:hypothetical protein